MANLGIYVLLKALSLHVLIFLFTGLVSFAYFCKFSEFLTFSYIEAC